MDGQTTTQSKYIKQRKPDQQPEIAANEVRIKGNQGHVKRYVQYAWSLLEGRRITFDGREREQDEKHEDEADADNKAEEEPQKFETIVLKATGRAINKAVTTAEVVKRKIPGLHQVTSLETLEITDVWEPKELGLKEVETKRRVASITIKLSRNPADVNPKDAGYQAPLPDDGFGAFPSAMQNENRPRRRTPGYRRGGGGGGYNRRGGGDGGGAGGGGGRRGGPRGGGGGGGRGGRGRRGGGGGSEQFDAGYGGGGYGGRGNRRGGYGGPRSPRGGGGGGGGDNGGYGGGRPRGGPRGGGGGRRGGPRGGYSQGGPRGGGYNSRRNDGRQDRYYEN